MLLLTTSIREQAGNLILIVILWQPFLFTICIVCICMCAHTHTHTHAYKESGLSNYGLALVQCGHGDSFFLNTTVPNSVSHPPIGLLKHGRTWGNMRILFKWGACCSTVLLHNTCPCVEGNPPRGLLEDQQSLYWAEAPPPQFSILHTLWPSHSLFSSMS